MKMTGNAGIPDSITLLLMSVLALPVVSAGTISDRHNMARDHASLPACKYLKADDSQKNAYRYPELDMGFCCLCPRGTKFIGDCNTSDPTSTQCQKCSEGEHVDFEPHLQLKCDKKSWRPCFHPKVYVRGTITEADSCKCPAGTADNGDTCVAVAPPTTTPHFKADIPSKESHAATEREQTSATNEPDRFIVVTKFRELAVSPSIKHLSLNQGTSTINTTIRRGSINQIDRSNTTAEEAASGIPTGIFVGGAVILLGLFIGIGIVIARNRSEPKPREQTKKQDYSPNSSRHTIVTMTGTDSPGVTKIDKMNRCNIDSNRSTPTIGGRNSRAEVMPLIGLADDVHTTSGSCQVISEAGIPANNFAPATSQTSGSQKQDESPSIEERANIQRKAEKIPSEQNRQFACDVATKLGQKCRRDHILPMFRLICGSAEEVVLGDLNEREKFTKEFLYQCMLHALALIGEVNLSPFYLWDKISSMDYGLYTEIVNGEIENYCQNIPLVPKS